MAWRRELASMEHDDDEMLDLMSPSEPEPPAYPYGLQFSLSYADLAKAGYEGGDPGDMCSFAALAEVTACSRDLQGCRIELEASQFAGEDGKFFDLERPAHLCLERRELDKMGLDDDCEVGDMIHLIGEARLERTSEARMHAIPAPGEQEPEAELHQMATLQIVRLAWEDESDESRQGY